MDEREGDVFQRALLFLYTAALRQEGIEAQLTVTQVPGSEKAKKEIA